MVILSKIVRQKHDVGTFIWIFTNQKVTKHELIEELDPRRQLESLVPEAFSSGAKSLLHRVLPHLVQDEEHTCT
ncbi:unnamed protein product [Sphenostylis stenocarpa]|uniref:Uncharacterized protein n=1 Tax=Sphenostylis stenocarpa TaxID=92480 RepID=A0AA86VI08_9FABA|nr:unnamed protein product [Sphenostylis stenocarpa]